MLKLQNQYRFGSNPKKLININLQYNDPLPNLFPIDEYKSIKAKQINNALDEAVPLRHPAIRHEAMRYLLNQEPVQYWKWLTKIHSTKLLYLK